MGSFLPKQISATNSFRKKLPLIATPALLVVVVVINVMLQPTFFSSMSLRYNFASFVPLVAAAIGQTIVIIAGGIDLSIGSIITLVNVVTVSLMGDSALRIALAVAAGLLTGILAGVINGIGVAIIRLQPIVATFATSFIWSGLALWIMPRPGGYVPASFYWPYRESFLAIPVAAWIIIVLYLIWFVIKKLPLAKYLYAVGGNEEGAFQNGIKVTRVKIASYALCGFFAAASGLAITANSASGDPFVGLPLTLSCITAVIIGGTGLSGGEGSPGASIAGAIILGLITNIIFFANVPTYYQDLIQGVIVVAALAGSGILSSGRDKS